MGSVFSAMKLEGTFLKSKVARRVFGLFFLSSLLPMGVLGWISFSQVESHLQEQSRERLEETGKSTGMSLLEKLFFVQSDLELVASQVEQNSLDVLHLQERVSERFDFVVLVQEEGEPVGLLGEVGGFRLRPEESEQLSKDRPTLFVRTEPGREKMLMGLEVGRQDPVQIVGGLSTNYLLNIEMGGAFSNRMEVSVLASDRSVFYSSLPVRTALRTKFDEFIQGPTSGSFEWSSDSEEYQASFRSLPLGFQFGYPYITLVLSESRSRAMAAVETFRRTFPILVFASILLVALLSTSQIRRSLGPIEKLREGTQRIARAEFQAKVEVESGDEFEELASSFNKMAVQLGRQFNTLATLGEIDRAVLSALKKEEIIKTVIKRIPELFGTDRVALTVFEQDEKGRARTYLATDTSGERHSVIDHLTISKNELERAAESAGGILLEKGKDPLPSYLNPLSEESIQTYLLQPIIVQKEVTGVLSLGYRDRANVSDEQWTYLRQITDQIAVAFSNAKLLNDLDELNWSALEALARTVDAKSRWTAGHSQRVTQMAIRIARELQLSDEEIEVIHRGGLLHDIGKIGVPAKILDKPGRLTDEEFEAIKLHPVIGARILEPVKAFAEVIPIVRSHHERIDGRGYPDGLAGDEIRFDVRIVAVADVFDAIYSDRPYRPRKPLDDVVQIIEQGSGSHFDPEPVKAFLSLVERERHSFLKVQENTTVEDYLPTHSYGA